MHLEHDGFIAGENHVFTKGRREHVLPWNVHPRVEHVAVGVGYFNDGMLVGVKGHFCERLSRHGVKRGAGKGI